MLECQYPWKRTQLAAPPEAEAEDDNLVVPVEDRAGGLLKRPNTHFISHDNVLLIFTKRLTLPTRPNWVP
jgi:hypothetical protein